MPPARTFTQEDVFAYHERPRPGKLEVLPCKSFADQKDLTLAYSPGVADACMAIHADASKAASYTGRENLVAVISNGTAVLGLGDIGPLAGKPVMEGKGVLFKAFADIDVFDLELNLKDPEKIIEVVKALEPTFGGVNLEDIKAPECFQIEETLRREMRIPVFHDDQHGTAVISGAGLINALDITRRGIEDAIIVIIGAGAAGTACAAFYVSMGVDPANIRMFDSRGILHTGRKDLGPHKARFAVAGDMSLAEALRGAHMVLGLSRKGVLSQDMIRGMAGTPVIFACANPDPEISFQDAKAARPDCIMGTGRSDYPNQINNVSGFPYIFRGALDVGAREINEAMKLAAARSLAALAREPVPQEVCAAYNIRKLEFGPEYVIPKPLDPRIIEWETPAVARAAMETGVAARPIADLEAYAAGLRARLAACRSRMRMVAESYRRR